jgi:hypothetical protein
MRQANIDPTILAIARLSATIQSCINNNYPVDTVLHQFCDGLGLDTKVVAKSALIHLNLLKDAVQSYGKNDSELISFCDSFRHQLDTAIAAQKEGAKQ